MWRWFRPKADACGCLLLADTVENSVMVFTAENERLRLKLLFFAERSSSGFA